jgi:hypothetical protein
MITCVCSRVRKKMMCFMLLRQWITCCLFSLAFITSISSLMEDRSTTRMPIFIATCQSWNMQLKPEVRLFQSENSSSSSSSGTIISYHNYAPYHGCSRCDSHVGVAAQAITGVLFDIEEKQKSGRQLDATAPTRAVDVVPILQRLDSTTPFSMPPSPPE